MNNWNTLTEKALAGEALTDAEALSVLKAPDAEFLEIVQAAWRVRKAQFGDSVHLCTICNAKSGKCSEDCSFCSQSAHNSSAVEVYPLLPSAQLQAGADYAVEHQINRYSLVTSGRGLESKDVDVACDAMANIADKSVEYCASFGILDDAGFAKLKAAGVTRYHHNLEASRSMFPTVCTTHSYQDRIDTIKRAQAAGLTICAGGLFGLGETDEQLLEMARDLQALSVESMPINFLTAIEGTQMAGKNYLSPVRCLKIIAFFRFLLPTQDILICGGRANLRELEGLIFHAGASGMMTGNYLTTAGKTAEQDRRMIDALGFQLR